eukprot:2812465-Alexandrium_andersonii.AAC.1
MLSARTRSTLPWQDKRAQEPARKPLATQLRARRHARSGARRSEGGRAQRRKRARASARGG